MQSGSRSLGAGGGSGDSADAEADRIRDLQRRRREATRHRAGIEAVLADAVEREQGAEEEDDEEDGGTTQPAPARVFVVFRGTSWQDPDGSLRESDTIVGVYGSEQSARVAVAALKKEDAEQSDAWYQPYVVQDA